MDYVYVCIRLDDYDNTTSLELVRALASILEKRHHRCLFGVIPYTPTRNESGQLGLQPLTGEPAAELRQLVQRGTVITALHGYAHQRGSKGEAEFEHGSLAEQAGKISSGKRLLEQLVGRPIRGFVPPWNGVSHVTEKALLAEGFEYVSTSMELGTTGLWRLTDFPSTAFWKSREAILDAKSNLATCPLVVLSGHFADFHHASGEIRQDVLQSFDDMLAWLDSQAEIRVIGMDDALRLCLRHPRRWRSIRRATWAWGLPYQLRRRLRWPKWIPTTQISFRLRMIQAAGFTFWASDAAASWLIGWSGVIWWGSRLPTWFSALCCLCAATLVMVGMSRRLNSAVDRMLMFAAAGCALGVASANFWLQQRL